MGVVFGLLRVLSRSALVRRDLGSRKHADQRISRPWSGSIALVMLALLSMGFCQEVAAYKAYFPNAECVVIIDTETEKGAGEICPGNLGSVHWLVMTPNGKKIYVYGGGANSTAKLSAIDVETKQYTNIQDPKTGDLIAPGPMAVTPDGKFLYVLHWHQGGSEYLIIDTSTDTVVDSFTIPFATEELTFSKNGALAYTHYGSDKDTKILVFDTSTKAVLSTFSLEWQISNEKGETEDYILSSPYFKYFSLEAVWQNIT